MTTPHKQVTAMIDGLSWPHKEICEQLRAMVTTKFPALEEAWKWLRPVYVTSGGPVCHFVANKNDVNLGFEQGAHFDDPKELLRGTGVNMRHVKIRTVEQLDLDYYETLLTQAVEMAD